MTQTKPNVTNATAPDLLNTLLGLQPDTLVAELRARRPDVARYTQGSYDALLTPSHPADVGPDERALIALRVAHLTASQPLIEHYEQRLVALGVPVATIAAAQHSPDSTVLTPRQVALLRHTDLLSNEPIAATPAHLADLQAVGLGAREIVTIAQLIAFLSFQVRLLAGLQALGQPFGEVA